MVIIMKLLKVVANNLKLCEKDFTISFIPIANKTEEDKEFELQKIDEELYTFNTLGIIGKRYNTDLVKNDNFVNNNLVLF